MTLNDTWARKKVAQLHSHTGLSLIFSTLLVSQNANQPSHDARSIDGSFALAEVANGYNNLQQTFSTPSLSVSANYAGEARTRTLSGFHATATRTPGVNYSYATSYSLNGAVTSSAMASQTLMFNTITPFVEFSDDLYPSSGVLLITGAANAQLRLTAINSSQVTQELDANGDGSFEGNKTVYWSSLL
ncbi:MAG: hypothetical protein COZ09_07905 [Comamonadaceae bacterium CG_4_10_14_3_um_filter_60_42]|nr:MAG: hypothetical protein COZ09_07905 [Comamonadaceae bacterium CG_4_10_14_3_um_filter_60_42]